MIKVGALNSIQGIYHVYCRSDILTVISILFMIVAIVAVTNCCYQRRPLVLLSMLPFIDNISSVHPLVLLLMVPLLFVSMLSQTVASELYLIIIVIAAFHWLYQCRMSLSVAINTADAVPNHCYHFCL